MRYPPIPDDLVRTRADWTRTYRALAAGPGPSAVLRRRLLRLSVRLVAHPYREGPPPSAGARMELRRQAERIDHG
ncbi:hypothetical protein M4J07_002902 [Streptomyces longispororuber]|nr:hypothetical protein [Streptomyces longispororuber]MCQ4212583.1 hypothetical protein [Streptomyces longispororuber]